MFKSLLIIFRNYYSIFYDVDLSQREVIQAPESSWTKVSLRDFPSDDSVTIFVKFSVTPPVSIMISIMRFCSEPSRASLTL